MIRDSADEEIARLRAELAACKAERDAWRLADDLPPSLLQDRELNRARRLRAESEGK